VEEVFCEVRQCGAIDFMASLPSASVDAFIVDPPYGTTQNPWDSVIPFKPMWDQIRRVGKPGAPAIFTASQPFSSALVMSNPQWFRHEWVWHKNKASGHLNAKRAPMKAHELVLVFCEKPPVYTPQKTQGHKPANAFYTAMNGKGYGAGKPVSGGGETDRYPRTVIDIAVVNNDDPAKVHTTQKPVRLMEYLVSTYTKENDLIVDFAMGSGTTGEAALNLNRRFLGCDIEEQWYEHSYQRLSAHPVFAQ
jgi:hypothetical protein